MYIPKKRWQVYEKLMKQNLITYYNNEQEEYCTDYLFGEEKWQIDVCRIAKLRNQDHYQMAMKFPTSSFEYDYVIGEIRGDADWLGDTYYYFARHYGYNSRWIDYWKIFNEKMMKSPLWNECILEEEEQCKKMGIVKTTTINWKDKYSEAYDDEKW